MEEGVQRTMEHQVEGEATLSNDAPIHEYESEIDDYNGHYVPYSLRRLCVIKKIYDKRKLKL